MAHHNLSGSFKTNKRRHVDSLTSDEEETSTEIADSWPRFIVIASADGNPLKLNPFAMSKGIQSACGEVTNVTRLRSGSILVEYARRQQSVNLLGLQQFVNTQVVVSVHRTLNSSRGIVRDRARCLSDMAEEEIAAELKHQGVTAVKRFSRKSEDGKFIPTNTYLFTFCLAKIPNSIKAGYFNIGVEVYVPNPLRCYKCQQFGHGAKTCTRKARCFRCSGIHEGSECTDDVKCANCDGEHVASSKSCPVFVSESQILKLKHTQNISYSAAKQLVQLPSKSPANITYSAAVSSPPPVLKITTASTSCQTLISWVKDDQFTIDDAQTSQSMKSTSASQTDHLTSAPQLLQTQKTVPPSEPSHVKVTKNIQGEAHLTKTEKKKLKKIRALQHLDLPSLADTTVEVHNPFEPLAMEVSPSLPVRGSGPPSHSRTPVEPP
ncbi:uncharacterized protein LOC125379297 [Haliotis rufescens]|uniref:uncharacterized protein LOC125379297 n=1 Tax=Haliotis rufescens TaxID=6454 RepID=UPI00201E79F0|nr:uncharacterized protein LOC125379297 [Haliotis rufescens]